MSPRAAANRPVPPSNGSTIHLAIEKLTTLPPEAINRAKSQRRIVLVVKGLGGSATQYRIARSMRIRSAW